MPLLSFIITYHNEPEALLRACLESIQALPLAEDEAEIIVVDDGSDSPPLNNFQFSSQSSGAGGTIFNFQLLRQQQSGLSVARNTGLAHAKGRYIQFVDADDCLVPSAYGAVLEQVRREQADIILFRMTTREAPTQNLSLRTRHSSPQHFLQHRNLRAAAWGYAFRREILGDLRFRPGLLHEDELFTPQLFLKGSSLVELDAKAYFYRLREGTITHAKAPEKVQSRLDDIHFILSDLQSFENPLLERRISQLTVDYLQRIWTLTRSLPELRRRMSELRKEGFLPLPLRCYSLRYLLAALLTRLPAF